MNADVSRKRKVCPQQNETYIELSSDEEIELTKKIKSEPGVSLVDLTKESNDALPSVSTISTFENSGRDDLYGETTKPVEFDVVMDKLLKSSRSRSPYSKEDSPKKSKVRPIRRSSDVEENRAKLPVVAMQDEIMKAINENTFVIITGSTGSGKTTQIPQFLYEAGYARDGMMICVTEPRKMATISMSRRVATEMNVSNREVSFAVRFESNYTAQTKIKFMTDGILLKEILADPMLSKYSAIVIDEAHERSIFSDIALGFLSSLARKRNSLRNKLKVIIMSATLDIKPFYDNRSLFAQKPAHIMVDSQMFRVDTHYDAKTNHNYLQNAFNKVCDIHLNWPSGGILVFVTGKEEVMSLCHRLKETFSITSETSNTRTHEHSYRSNRDRHMDKRTSKNYKKHPRTQGKYRYDKSANSSHRHKKESRRTDPMHVLPLFSLLSSEQQQEVFEQPPQGTRLCVVATNIAETSLTIPNIVYVVDTGKMKENVYNSTNGISSLTISWTSKASADQRSGRAGRVQDGHCFRLYSTSVFENEFPKNTVPDIQKRPIDDIVLTLKSLQIPLFSFPYVTPPPKAQIKQSVRRLIALGALEEKRDSQDECSLYITRLGKMMSELPILPRFAKMIIKSFEHCDLVQYVVLLVCALSTKEIMMQRSPDIDVPQNRQARLLGEIMTLLVAVINAINKDNVDDERTENMRPRALQELQKLRWQLTTKITDLHPYLDLDIDSYIELPNSEQIKHIRLIIFSGSLENVAKKLTAADQIVDEDIVMNSYRMTNSTEPALLHQNSPFGKNAPTWLMYQDVFQHEKNGKNFLKGVSVIDPTWLLEYAPSMCILSDPLDDPAPRYDHNLDRVVCHRTAKFGDYAWVLPSVEKPYPLCYQLYVWAAYFFLEGVLCPQLKKFRHLIHDTRTVVLPRPSGTDRKAQDLIREFEAHECYSYGRLVAIWQAKPTYLLREYQAWFKKESLKPLIQNIWTNLRDGN